MGKSNIVIDGALVFKQETEEIFNLEDIVNVLFADVEIFRSVIAALDNVLTITETVCVKIKTYVILAFRTADRNVLVTFVFFHFCFFVDEFTKIKRALSDNSGNNAQKRKLLGNLMTPSKTTKFNTEK